MKLAVLYSRVRAEEKLLFDALDARGVTYDKIDDREVIFDLQNPGAWLEYDVVLGTVHQSLARAQRAQDSQRLAHSDGEHVVRREHVRRQAGHFDRAGASRRADDAHQSRVHARIGNQSHRRTGLSGDFETGGRFLGTLVVQGE